MEKKRDAEDVDSYSIKTKKVATDDGQRQIKRPLDAYAKHMMLMKQFLVDSKKAKEETNKYKLNIVTDLDVLKANHKFLWDDDDPADSWERRVARKYYDKLFKEYCIADLKRYKENKIALRWRIEKEVVDGKGQFICADVNCSARDLLKSWEVNFGYIEQGEKKNALVKIRLCPDCSYKLNYHHKRKEAKKVHKYGKHKSTVKLENEFKDIGSSNITDHPHSSSNLPSDIEVKEEKDEDSTIWSSTQAQINTEPESIETEMDEYLSELFM